MDTTSVEIKLDGRTAYLSAPMREYPEGNKAMFEKAETSLTAHAFAAGFLDNPTAQVMVVHAQQEGVYTNGHTLAAAMQLADFAVMLPGWARPGGCVEDLILFMHMRKPVFGYDPDTGALIRMSAAYIGFPEKTGDDLDALLDGEAADPFDKNEDEDLPDPDES